jgi:hypothetical protein
LRLPFLGDVLVVSGAPGHSNPALPAWNKHFSAKPIDSSSRPLFPQKLAASRFVRFAHRFGVNDARSIPVVGLW